MKIHEEKLAVAGPVGNIEVLIGCVLSHGKQGCVDCIHQGRAVHICHGVVVICANYRLGVGTTFRLYQSVVAIYVGVLDGPCLIKQKECATCMITLIHSDDFILKNKWGRGYSAPITQIQLAHLSRYPVHNIY